MKNNILFIILSFSLLSCQHKGDSTKNSTIETIPVFSNYTAELPFSAFVDTIELIPLETTEAHLRKVQSWRTGIQERKESVRLWLGTELCLQSHHGHGRKRFCKQYRRQVQ